VFSWGGNPGSGSLHRLRDAVERGWPVRSSSRSYSHAGLAAAYVAGASGLPFGMLAAASSAPDLPRVNPSIRAVTCPYSGVRSRPCPRSART
jgi:glutaconate CoA-transferase subunit A